MRQVNTLIEGLQLTMEENGIAAKDQTLGERWVQRDHREVAFAAPVMRTNAAHNLKPAAELTAMGPMLKPSERTSEERMQANWRLQSSQKPPQIATSSISSALAGQWPGIAKKGRILSALSRFLYTHS